MSLLVEHAERELRLAGLFNMDADYGGAAGKAALELVRAFAEQGHSGASAALVLAAFEKLARWKTLTPITSEPSEWMDVAERPAGDPKAVWQNVRAGSCFSRDGGKTWYDIDEPAQGQPHHPAHDKAEVAP